VILVVGRMLRRKGHHVVVDTVRPPQGDGRQGHRSAFSQASTRAPATPPNCGPVLATGTADVIRMTGPMDDVAGGLRRGIRCGVGGGATRRHAARADRGAGHGAAGDRLRAWRRSDVVLAPPAVPHDQMNRHAISDRRQFGARGRAECGCFQCRPRYSQRSAHAAAPGCSAISTAPAAAELTLKLYAEVAARGLTLNSPNPLISARNRAGITLNLWAVCPDPRRIYNLRGEACHSSPDESTGTRPEGWPAY